MVIGAYICAQDEQSGQEPAAGKEKPAQQQTVQRPATQQPAPEQQTAPQPFAQPEELKKPAGNAQQTPSAPAEEKKSPKPKAKAEEGTTVSTVLTEKSDPSQSVEKAVKLPAGVLFGNFSKQDGPFLIEGSIIVPSGQTLEFGPGCTIYMGGTYSTITVFGQLIAKGTSDEPVIFQSANPNPNPWDWDRIYCRSRNRCIFNYCVIRHSNYGIYVENGSAAVEHCVFENNSLHGMVVKNSDVTLNNSVFHKGHVLALFCQEGGNIRADSLIIQDNITGMACTEKAYLSCTNGRISKNRNGIAVCRGSSVTIVAADVTRNKIGLVAEMEIPRKMQEMIYGNVIDMKVVKRDELEELLKPPEGVKSIVLPKATAEVKVGESFQPGFSALAAPREAQASFIGNVETGVSYFLPRSRPHPVTDSVRMQTRYIGEHSNTWFAGLQPKVTMFAQGKRGGADVNLNADLYANHWIQQVKHNMFALSMNYANQALVIGDVYENVSETSMSGRKITGVHYTGQFFDMGRGVKRVEFKLAAGETEPPKDSGDHDFEIPNDTIKSGFSQRQQMTYVASLSVKPTYFSTVSARGIIARDQQEKVILAKSVSDSGVPNPIEAQTGIIDGNVVLLDGMLEVFAEIDVGAHDTIDSADFGDIAWYKPMVTTAVPRVFGLLAPDSARHNLAGTIGARGKLQGYDLGVSFTEIRNKYFSAGNPYLEADRRYLILDGAKQLLENLELQAQYRYERTSASYTLADEGSGPVDKNKLSLSGTYSFGEGKPSVTADYDIRLEANDDMGERMVDIIDTLRDASGVDTAYSISTEGVDEEYLARRIDNGLGLETKQRFGNGMDYSVKYRMLWENDFSDYPDTTMMDADDAWTHEITLRHGFRIRQILKNRISVTLKYKTENDDSLDSYTYKISDNVRATIIPRKLTANIKGDITRRLDHEYDPERTADPWFYTQYILWGVEGELKYAFTPKLSGTMMLRYEKAYDENEGGENYTATIGGLFVTYLF